MTFGWEDQLRVPKGNGRRSGRWVDMPWRTASKLMEALSDVDNTRGLHLPGGKGENGKLRDALRDALKAANKAEGRARGIDFDPSDPEVGDDALKVTDALERAYNIVHGSGDKLSVLDGSGAEVDGEAKDAFLAEYADAVLDAHRNADLFSSTDWSHLSDDDSSVLDEARIDNEFPLEEDGGGNAGLLKKAGWEVVEAVRDSNDDDNDDGEGDGDPVPADPVPDFGPEDDGLDRADPVMLDGAPAEMVSAALDAVAGDGGAAGDPDVFRPDVADALRADWQKGLLGTVQIGDGVVELVDPGGTVIATVSADGSLMRGPGYEAWVEAAQGRYPGHRFWKSSDAVIRDIIEGSSELATQPRKETTMSVQNNESERLSSVDAAEAEAAIDDATLATVTPIRQAPSLLASAAPVQPPAEWFAEPKLTGPTGLIVTPEGRVYGHVASWGVCHIAHTSQCITAPHSRTGYAYFHTGTILTREGSQIPVGRITLDTVHAGPKLNALSAAQHYENTGAVVADVACGEDQWGIWIAGAVRPSASDDQVRALRAAPLSGDWREVAGNLELVAALSVNVPGFPIPRPTGLVASGVLRSLVASGMVPPAPPRSRLEALAMRGHTPTSAEDIQYLRVLAARAAEVLAASADMEGEVVEADGEDCGCDAVYTTEDLSPEVLALANRMQAARMAERVRALRSAPSVVSDAAAMTAYGCNCRNKTRPMGSKAAVTTNTTTAKPKQSFSYTPPLGGKPIVGSLLEVRAAAKRNGGAGTITPA